MYLDLPTLIWFMTLTSFTLGAAVLVVGWRSRAGDGLTAWGSSVAIQGLSYPLFEIRFHDWLGLSIVTTNVATSASVALSILALSQFQRSQRPPPANWVIWLPVLVCGIVAGFTVDHHEVRNELIALVISAQALLLVRLAAHPISSGRRERSRSLLVAGSVAMLLLLLLRVMMIVRHEEWIDENIGVPIGLQSYSYVFALMILIFNTVGFLLMHKDRALEIQR
ncbi:MAG: hypothetical protein RLZZ200_1469, partial [Pseudomonadota bacterium]